MRASRLYNLDRSLLTKIFRSGLQVRLDQDLPLFQSFRHHCIPSSQYFTMKSSLLITTIFFGVSALATPMSLEAMPRELRGVLSERDINKCPGNRDMTFCLSFLENQCHSILDIAACMNRNTELCGCYCACVQSDCDAAMTPMPDTCKT